MNTFRSTKAQKILLELSNGFIKIYSQLFFFLLFLISCENHETEDIETKTNIHFIIANESLVDDTLDIKIHFNDILLVNDIFIFSGSSTDYQFFDQVIPKGQYQISVKSDMADKVREEQYDFKEDNYWFLIYYWNPKGQASPDHEFHFTIHNDTIRVG